ncbi:very short patch repair endonuclease [Robertkochia flava]|uniref:very short patch repair endonuclease n=1 Tax=Robertkochia flava TaxID=3447986 RepID=UPI001CCB4F91|nr:very short patch repair endonuclease [Robertkochia marina]
MDRFDKDKRSEIMKSIKNKDSKIETVLRKTLWSKGYRYRKNVNSLPGKPDIVFKSKKVVVFCDSEFWHGKNWKESKHNIKSKREFWWPKIERNIERDREVNETLEEMGWTVLRFWGKDIIKNPDSCCQKIIDNLK